MRTNPPLPELPFRQLGDPLYSQRNPHQLFLLVLSMVSAITLVEGLTGSPTLDEVLPGTTVIAWGLFLLLGSATALLGMWLPRTWTGLVVERSGLGLVSVAAMGYAGLIFVLAPDESFTAFIHLAYGLSCAWRVRQIESRLKWVRAQVARLNKGVEGE